MPVWSNPRHEHFAQCQGRNAVDACELAGFNRNDSTSSKKVTSLIPKELAVQQLPANLSGETTLKSRRGFVGTFFYSAEGNGFTRRLTYLPISFRRRRSSSIQSLTGSTLHVARSSH
jgi:hypothetical protein